MKETNIKLAQQDIEEALITVEAMEETLNKNSISDKFIREKFLFLSNKVQQLEKILKEEGIL